MSNEHYDTAVEVAYEVNADALHGLSPAELMMRREEEEGHVAGVNELRAACLLSVLMCITWNVTSLRQIRDRLGVLTSYKAPDLLPQKVWHGRADWQAVRVEMARCPRIEWQDCAGRILIDFIARDGWGEREVGRRALLLLYAFQSDKSARPPMARTLECIGTVLGLQAENKRAAVSAALMTLVLEMVRRMERLSKQKGTLKFWFMKSAECREALSVAMMGKRNRCAGMTNAECEMTKGKL
jgi:hypothetical protein